VRQQGKRQAQHRFSIIAARKQVALDFGFVPVERLVIGDMGSMAFQVDVHIAI
jgi:hypothetical protein